MNTNKCYLKSNVKMEPLIWQWYAWPYLISPATAACNIVYRHLKIMRSYLQAPEIHAEAVKNPALLGGPFIDLDSKDINKIENLLNSTETNCEALIKLAFSLKDFDRILQSKAKGDSLTTLYQLVPDNLRGMIELAYDLNNQPVIRLIEPIFYQQYYTDKYQSVSLSLIESDFRPFAMSTPRVASENEIFLDVPFSDERLDALFLMRYEPKSWKEVQDLFSIQPDRKDLFKSFFTEKNTVNPENINYKDEQVRMRYFGHACVLLQTEAVSILVDPVISYAVNSPVSRFTFQDLPEIIDYVILTHNHQDHILFETLIQIRHKVKCIIFPRNLKGALVDPSLMLILQRLGFKNLMAIDDFQSVKVPSGEITGLPFLGEHADLNIQSKLTYVVNLKNKKFLFAADACSVDVKLYEHIFNQVGAIDILFLGMECDGAPLSWLYGPLLSKPLNRSYDNSRQLSGADSANAWSLVQSSKSTQVYIYAMGQEPWLNYIMALKYTDDSKQILESNHLIQLCQKNGIMAERLYGKKELHL